MIPKRIIVITVAVFLLAVISLCLYISVPFTKPIVVNVTDPDGSITSTATHGDSFDQLIWEKQTRVPLDKFRSAAEVLEYYDNQLTNQHWIVPDERLFFNPFEALCRDAANLTDNQSNNYLLKFYSTEEELGSAPPAPPYQICLYVKLSPNEGFYLVRLLSILPGLWDNFNT